MTSSAANCSRSASRRASDSILGSRLALPMPSAAAGLVRAAEAHVDSIRALELRSTAQLVAENRLVELGLPGAAPAPGDVEMIGRTWHVAVAEKASDDPDLNAVAVSVTAAGETTPLITLDGFVDAGSTTP